MPWHRSTVNSAFNHKGKELWGDSGSWRTATAYEAAKAMLSGIASATTRQQLQQALANPGFSAPGVLGKITFQPSGERQIKGTLVKILPGKVSGTGFDFQRYH